MSLWHFFSDREADVIQSVVDDFEAANPDVKVDVHSGQDDEKLQKAISAGNNVDVGISYSTDIVGAFCSSGAFRDLGPYIERDGVDLSQFSDTVASYTAVRRHALRAPGARRRLRAVRNNDLLAAAGYDHAPQTLEELEEMALAMTTYNADGSIDILGFNPLMGYYENTPTNWAMTVGATWLKHDGTSAIGSDPGWAEILQWQKDFVDKIGYDKLQAYSAGMGQEFSADNAFQTGKIAMNFDGEYRTAFIADQAPDLNYSTAPIPTLADHTRQLRRRLRHRQHRRHREELEEPRARLGAAEVPDDEHRRRREAQQRAQERADHHVGAREPRPRGDAAVPDLPRHHAEPELDDHAAEQGRRRLPAGDRATTGTSTSRATAATSPTGLEGVDKTINDSLVPGRRAVIPVTATTASGRVASLAIRPARPAPALAAPAPAHRVRDAGAGPAGPRRSSSSTR